MAHRELDEAVADAYGIAVSASDEAVLSFLLELNEKRAKPPTGLTPADNNGVIGPLYLSAPTDTAMIQHKMAFAAFLTPHGWMETDRSVVMLLNFPARPHLWKQIKLYPVITSTRA